MTTTLEGPTSEQVRFIAFGAFGKNFVDSSYIGSSNADLEEGDSSNGTQLLHSKDNITGIVAFDVDATLARATIQPKQLHVSNSETTSYNTPKETTLFSNQQILPYQILIVKNVCLVLTVANLSVFKKGLVDCHI